MLNQDVFNRNVKEYIEEERARLGRPLSNDEMVAPIARAWVDACGVDSHGPIYGTGGEVSAVREAAGRSRRLMREDPLLMSQAIHAAHMESIRGDVRTEMRDEIREEIAKQVEEQFGKGKEKRVETGCTSRIYPASYHQEMLEFTQQMASGTSDGRSYKDFMRDLDLKYFPEDEDHADHLDDIA